MTTLEIFQLYKQGWDEQHRPELLYNDDKICVVMHPKKLWVLMEYNGVIYRNGGMYYQKLGKQEKHGRGFTLDECFTLSEFNIMVQLWELYNGEEL